MLPTLAAQPTQPQHGGSDALGVPQWDFSTNSNATGPCPHTVVALAGADITRYPDPTYTALRHTLAAWHGVDSWRIVLGSSGSELIARLTAWVSAQVRTSDKGCSNNGSGNTAQPAVWLPAYHYADYAHAAALHGMVQVADVGQADLIWLCAPSSPLGQALALPQQWAQRRQSSTVVLDCAYAPLQLTDSPLLPEAFNRHAAWQIFTPNKALGVCGLRAAYAIAPQHLPDEAVQSVAARAASWPLGAYGVALLHNWCSTATQDWLAQSRQTLQGYKAAQLQALQALGWECCPSETSFFVARPSLPAGMDLAQMLSALRAQGIKLRDCASFGLSGHVRLCVHTPQAQAVLLQTLRGLGCKG